MADARPQPSAGRSVQSDSRQKTLRIISLCLKTALVLFPVPAALLTKAPIEMIFAAAYATLFTAAGFLALWEITAGLNRLNETLAGQRRPS
jgi:hypothetical protein